MSVHRGVVLTCHLLCSHDPSPVAVRLQQYLRILSIEQVGCAGTEVAYCVLICILMLLSDSCLWMPSWSQLLLCCGSCHRIANLHVVAVLPYSYINATQC